MGCRCNERRVQLAGAVKAVARGDLRTASSNVAAASRTLVEDARSGSLRQAAHQLVAARFGIRRR